MATHLQKGVTKPRIAITMGDPAGIGPEIICKALACPEVYGICRPVVFGDLQWLRHTAASLSVGVQSAVDVQSAPAGELLANASTILVRQATDADVSHTPIGCISADAGKAAAEFIISAAKAALSGEFDAIVTAPINKEAIALGGFAYPGHTELLAEVTHTRDYGMLLLSGSLRVVHVSTHVSLQEAIARVKAPRILDCIRLGHRACIDLGLANPRIAVAGLNPHAGEHGLFGSEERDEITPAILAAQANGINATGPHPPDTVFARAVQGEFDLVVAMYHDQGHIAVKLHGFDSGVNVTIGLPIIRVSVDHGTAFDIAGQGIAREASLLEAIRVAVQMVASKAGGEARAD